MSGAPRGGIKVYSARTEFIIPQRLRDHANMRFPPPAQLVMVWLLMLAASIAGCGKQPWNDPYRSDDVGRAIFYGAFAERPKHLDPVSSYSENEAQFTGQIYEPVVQYHFLKRPYQLVPLTATALPEARYYDKDGQPLPADAPAEMVAAAVYRVNLKQGIRYQPHPAFAQRGDGTYFYADLKATEVARYGTLADFTHTGTRELIAEDYVYEIKRLVHPHLHSPVAGLMGKYIKGLTALGEQMAKNEGANTGFVDLRKYDFDGARVIDRYTFEIRITEKYPQFRYWLAMSFFAPVPWEADRFYGMPGMKERNFTLDWYPVGTGPYMLTENNPNRRMVLKRNPNFRGEPYPERGAPGDAVAGMLGMAGKTMPFIDVAYYSLEKEEIPQWTKFLQGYYDVAAVLPDSFDQAIQFGVKGEAELTPSMLEKGIKLVTAVEQSVSYMGFNMADPVVGGDSERARLLRRAISIAVDFEEMVSIFANGRGVPAHGPIPPEIFGYRAGQAGINPYVYEWRAGHAARRSVDDARALLRQAGYVDGRDPATGQPLALYYEAIGGGPSGKAQLNWYRKQFEKLGIQLVIRVTDYNRFQEKVREGTAQIFSWGWNADYPDPENFLFLLYGPNGKSKHGGENAANYHNEEFDQLYVRMRALPNGAERQRLIDRMVEIVRHDSPWLWGFHPMAYALNHTWYGNSKPNLMARNTLKYKTIDEDLRTRLRAEWNTALLWPVVAVVSLLLLSAIPAWRSYRARQRAPAR